MNTFPRSSIHGERGATLVETVVSAAITTVMAAGLLVGAITVQKSFAASRHHIDAQAQQMRVTDYLALDLRRALTVTTATDQITLTIPEYFDGSGTPILPTVNGGRIKYGPNPITVTYFKRADTIVRQEGNVETIIATDVDDFQLNFQDLGQSVTASVTFIPRFQFSSNANASVRDGTATYATTLLRNKRQN
jgi:hypothetical protein